MRVGLASLYIAIGLLGGFAIGRASYAIALGDAKEYLVVIPAALLMLVLVGVSVYVQARLRRGRT